MSLRDALVEKIEAENAELRERIAELETLLGMRCETPLCLDLTRSEASLFGLLLNRDLVTKDMAVTTIYGGRPDVEVAEEKIVDVFICKMRRKLKRFDIAIETKWGQGYYLPADSKRVARSLMQEHAA